MAGLSAGRYREAGGGPPPPLSPPVSAPGHLALGHPSGAAGALVEEALLDVAGPDAGRYREADGGLPPPLSPPVRAPGTRPANRPELRLAAAASLFVRAGGDLPAYAIRSVRTATSARELIAAWSVGAASPRPGALVGAARATEILLNAILPFAAAQKGLAQRAFVLAIELPPLSPYGKTVFLERNLVRRDGRRRARSALDQQGLLALHARWCSQGGCGICPLS